MLLEFLSNASTLILITAIGAFVIMLQSRYHCMKVAGWLLAKADALAEFERRKEVYWRDLPPVGDGSARSVRSVVREVQS